MIAIESQRTIPNAAQIPYITAQEAAHLMRVELDRLLGLLDQLEADDWHQPTACTLWDVREIVAHQAGGYASGTGYREMIRQYSKIPKKGQLPEDAVNELQVRERKGMAPAELIAELRRVAPVAIEKWAYHFRLVKWITLPRPEAGNLSLRHLMWVIHSRDTWMHRLDICRATGRSFEQTREHDGRIAELVMGDLARTLPARLDAQAVIFDLGGTAGGTWQIGQGEARATIRMDVLEFNIFASGRYTYQEARPKATIHGDTALGERALQHSIVLY